jgi:hypothetical protein
MSKEFERSNGAPSWLGAKENARHVSGHFGL